MTRQNTAIESLPSQRGLITEANPIDFPEGATLDERNFEIDGRGIRKKRKGMQLMLERYSATGLPFSNFFESDIFTFVWDSPGGDSSRRFLVVHAVNIIRIFDITSVEDGNLFSNLIYTSIYITQQPSISVVSGHLVLVGGGQTTSESQEVSIFTWRDGSIDRIQKRLKVRDIWGLESNMYFVVPDTTLFTWIFESSRSYDYLDIRPSRIGPQPNPYYNLTPHVYNLRNQGWARPVKTKDSDNKTDPLLVVTNEQGAAILPATSESLSASMHPDATNNQDPVVDRFWPSTWEGSVPSKSEPARGHYIIDFFNRGASRADAYFSSRYQVSVDWFGEADISEDIPEDVTEGVVSVCASFAGRAWFSGFSGQNINGDLYSPNTSSYVLFSRIGSSPEELTLCFQANDPTDPEFPDLLDTDGGSIEISGADTIVAMKEYMGRLLVFARNGVWAISGGSEYGFSATNYRVDKISSHGIVGRESIVEAVDYLMYWSPEGIMSLSPNDSGHIIVQSITDNTIQSFYDKIGEDERHLVKGVHDPVTKTVRWIYNISYSKFQEDRPNYSLELVFNYRIGAFTVNNYLATFDKRITSVFSLGRETSLGIGTSLYYIVSIQEGQSDQVIIDSAQPTGDTFRDLDFPMPPTYIITGYLASGDNQRIKQVPYLTMHFIRTEELYEPRYIADVPYNFIRESSCKVQARWEWSNSPNSNRWSKEFQAYRYNRLYYPEQWGAEYDTGFETIVTKNKIRGKGRTVSFMFKAEDEKDCQLVGWSFILGVNGNV